MLREHRRRSLPEIYALAVCFVAAIVLSISTIMILSNMAQIAAPEFFMSPHLARHYQSNHSYRLYLLDRGMTKAGDEADLTHLRQEEYADVVSGERRRGYQSVVRSLIVIFVLAIVFVLHWRLARRLSHKSDDPAASG